MAESIVVSIIGKLMDPLLEEITFLDSVSDKVQSVRRKLEWIKPFLADAEARSNKSEVIQHWVAEVREVAYRIEDAIDIYVIDIQGERERMIEIQRERERMKCSQFMACMKWVYKVPIMKPIALHKLGVELDNIEATLQSINENKNLFSINDLGESSRARVEAERRLPLEYIDDESKIIELDAHKIIKEKLLKPQTSDLSVISIVGPGGLGKTTLAQKVFNSAAVKQKFNVRIWIPVSQKFERIQILTKILEGIHEVKQEERSRDDDYFIREIRKSLECTNFLIVLDDVWSKTLWPNIRVACPPSENNEGRVLITTRDHDVAHKAESELFELQILNPEQSQTLLFKIAFPKQNAPKGLDSLATELAKKCGYLPLALVVVGGMLRMKESCYEWKRVADNIIDWRGECMPILATSYHNMPITLKTCFMYLASFPEDREIDAKSLVRKWVAEDFISDEVTGNNCLEQLVQRCLIIPIERSDDGSLEQCRLHDLLHELAIREAKENNFFLVFINKNPDQSFNDARRASLQSCTFGDGNFENQKKVKRIYNKKLRSLMVFDDCLPDELSRYKLLKVLVMHGCNISFSKLEKWLEELIHLRHLELRDCEIDTLKIPQSIGHLKNLLTLDCTGTWVNELPESLWSITTLRHVLLRNGALSRFGFLGYVGGRCPLPLTNLPNLRTLSTVTFKPPSPIPDALGNFSNLCELCLRNSDPWVATLLKELNQLISLGIGNMSNSLTLDVVDMRVFPFYNNLQCLFLWGTWPEHVELRSHLFPPRLIRLRLVECGFKKDPMPELEQLQNLEILQIAILKWCEMTVTCSAGGFPQLQQLDLKDYPVKEFNINPGAMPMLKKLFLYSYEKMNIPELQHLKMLQEFSWEVGYSDMEIQEIREKNQHKLQHIPSVVLRRTSAIQKKN